MPKKKSSQSVSPEVLASVKDHLAALEARLFPAGSKPTIEQRRRDIRSTILKMFNKS